MTYFVKQTLRKSGPLKKADPGPLRKAKPMPTFTVLAKNIFMTSQRLLLSNMTTVFLENCSLKTPKLGSFGPKIRDFEHCAKLCIFANSKMLISNMTIPFQTYSPRHPNKAILVPKLILFLYFACTTFCISANSWVLIPNITITFSNFQSKNYPKGHFWFQIYRLLFLHETFLNLQLQIKEIRHFQFQN